MRPLRVGDVCITVNSEYPTLNNGVLVVVLFIDLDRADGAVHLIERIDRLPLGSVVMPDGIPRLFQARRAWCVRRKLKPIDEQDPTVADMLELEVAR